MRGKGGASAFSRAGLPRPADPRPGLGRACENIDFRMCGEDDARWRLSRAARDADLILVRRRHGPPRRRANSAELARRLGLPILLVIDAAAMAGSFGTVAFGPEKLWRGREHHPRARQPHRQQAPRRTRAENPAARHHLGRPPAARCRLRAARAPSRPAAGGRDRRPRRAHRAHGRCAGRHTRRGTTARRRIRRIASADF